MTIIRYLVATTVLVLAAAALYTLIPGPVGSTPHGGHGAEENGEHAHGPKAATMPDAKVKAAGIELDTAGPQVLKETMTVNGLLQANQETIAQVTSRFPGVVRDVAKRIGDSVAKGETLARIESNQSLTTYDLRSPLAGTIIERRVALGEYVSEQKPAFVVADLSTVWADFSIHRRDLRRVKPGDVLIIDPEDGGEPVEATVAYLSPVGASDTQSGLARAVVPNPDGRFRPGLFVTGRLVLAEKRVAVAVKLSALQSLDNRTVVFVRSGEGFEPREVEVGQRDGDRAEILFGLDEGDIYAAGNSFVIKAEIGKASAAHEH